MKQRAWMPFLILSTCVLAARADPVCEVLAVRGEAYAGQQALRLGQHLDVGTEVHTGADGRVRLRFVDGSVLVVADHSTLKIKRFELESGGTRHASFLLDLGLIGQTVQPQAGGSWEVRTPTAVTAVRGTEFMVEVGANLATAVNVQSGEVSVDTVGQGGKGGATRGLSAKLPVVLSASHQGTDCNADYGCTPAATWSPSRIESAQGRLSF
ncbi:MAG: FecR domain-containing protein [Burkholderiaceae bacterium]|nr:FecR domain-containing protein [Roseateles sp.]MBV8470783.1 FecR domain-containing protein [Burkholderiaceae bacterium]